MPPDRLEAVQRLTASVYHDLRGIAERQFRREHPGHTLQATAIAHEAWLRLAQAEQLEYQGRAQFLALASRAIRRLLVDHVRRQRAEKRGGDAVRVTVAEELLGDRGDDLLELEDALERLGALSERQAEIVQMRFFGGMSVAETATALSVSERTVKADWQLAKAWLWRELRGE